MCESERLLQLANKRLNRLAWKQQQVLDMINHHKPDEPYSGEAHLLLQIYKLLSEP